MPDGLWLLLLVLLVRPYKEPTNCFKDLAIIGTAHPTLGLHGKIYISF